MQVEWYGQSAFRLSTPDTTVVIDPVRRHVVPDARARDPVGLPGDRRTSTRRSAARHPRARRPQRRRGRRRRAGGPALDRRQARLAPRRAHRGRLRARRAAGTERGPNTVFVFELDGLRVSHFGDFGQSDLRDEQAAAHRRDVDLLILPVGGGPDDRAAQGASAIVDRLQPRWVVPMHYRTRASSFLETARRVPRRRPRPPPRRPVARDRRAARRGWAGGRRTRRP